MPATGPCIITIKGPHAFIGWREPLLRPISIDCRMTQRTVILSDTHMGRDHSTAGSPDALRPLWEGADRLIINGDVAEVGHYCYRGAAARHVLRLQELCEQDGVELTLMSGNHDPLLSDVRFLHLADGLIFLTHGDVLHPAIAPWSPYGKQLRRLTDEARQRYADEHGLFPDSLQARLEIAQHVSMHEWQEENIVDRGPMLTLLMRPWMVFEVLNFWRQTPSLAAGFTAAHAPKARFCIIGHTHRPGAWQVRDRWVINTGCFGFPGRPQAVVMHDDRLHIHAITGSTEAWRLSDQPSRSFDLPKGSAAAEPVTEPIGVPWDMNDLTPDLA